MGETKPMKTTIHEKNYSVSPRLREIIDKKLERIQKYFDNDVECIIVCQKVGPTEKMEITLVTHQGHAFRAQEEDRSMYNNIDNALKKIERQIVRNKERLNTIIRKNAVEDKKFAYIKPKEVKNLGRSEIKKVKSFPIKVLSDQEAELDLATLDHNFFMYADEITHGVKVMYRRIDGHVGVIEIQNASLRSATAVKTEIKKQVTTATAYAKTEITKQVAKVKAKTPTKKK